MKDQETPIVVRHGFGLSHVLLAALGGAAAGAVAAYLTAPRSGLENRKQLRTLAHDTRETVGRVPGALHAASEAARNAFSETLDAA
jgi:gas vesicle protein